MARKQKKLTRKQRIQQQQAAIGRRREDKGWVPPQERARQRHEILEDMLPLFPVIEEAATTPGLGVEALMEAVVDSSDLIEEPEFEEIILDPILCVNTYVDVSTELGLTPEDLAGLSPDEREDKQLELLEITTRRLLDDEWGQQITTALNNLRLRLKRSGKKPDEIARVAAIQSFLSERQSRDMWPMIGLNLAIVERSLQTGFELFHLSAEVEESLAEDAATPQTLLEKVRQSSLAQKVSGVLQKVPGLNRFLEDQVDKIWEEGVEAVFNGELYLELYTEEELEAGVNIFKTLLGEIAKGTSFDQISKIVVSPEKGQALVRQVDAYINQLFTAERLEQLRAHLNTIGRESDYPQKYTTFLMMLSEYMAQEDATEAEKLFLMKSFLGELKFLAALAEAAKSDGEQEE